MKIDKNNVLKIVSLSALLIISIIILIKVIPYFKQMSTVEGRENLKYIIKNSGIKGAILVLGLIIAQIFFMFLPGEPVEVLAGMCFGSIGGLIIMYIGVFISSIIIFFLVRKLGRSFVYTFVNKQKIEKLENNNIFKSKNTETILLLLFIIPGTPKDLLTYVGAFMPVKQWRFIILSTIARFPSIITSTIVGNNILNGKWSIVIGVYGITFILSTIIIYIANKKAQIKEIINI